jgi:hypothetical protein
MIMKEKKTKEYVRPLISKPKQYQLDAAMQLAAKRSGIQPELISMNSNIRIWEDRGT